LFDTGADGDILLCNIKNLALIPGVKEAGSRRVDLKEDDLERLLSE